MYYIFYPVEYKQHSCEQLCITEIGSKQIIQVGSVSHLVAFFVVVQICIVLMPFWIRIGIRKAMPIHMRIADPAPSFILVGKSELLLLRSGTFTTKPVYID